MLITDNFKLFKNTTYDKLCSKTYNKQKHSMKSYILRSKNIVIYCYVIFFFYIFLHTCTSCIFVLGNN